MGRKPNALIKMMICQVGFLLRNLRTKKSAGELDQGAWGLIPGIHTHHQVPPAEGNCPEAI